MPLVGRSIQGRPVNPDHEIGEQLLRVAWEQIRSWDSGNVINVPAARRAVDAGASPEDLAGAMAAAAYDAIFSLLSLLSAEHCEEGTDVRTGWMLVEADIDSDGRAFPSGTSIDFLHEGLLSADPTGREGRDLFS